MQQECTMTLYQGVPVNEWKLLLYFAFSFFFVVLCFAAAAFILWYTIILKTNKKGNKRIRKLTEKAATDEKAKLQLEKLQRKRKRKKAQDKPALLRKLAFFLISLTLGIVILCTGAIPLLTDYIKKDYIVYTGCFTVETEYNGRFISNSVTLEDGTCLSDSAGLRGDDTYGTVVYTKRTKITLGGRSDSQN